MYVKCTAAEEFKLTASKNNTYYHQHSAIKPVSTFILKIHQNTIILTLLTFRSLSHRDQNVSE